MQQSDIIRDFIRYLVNSTDNHLFRFNESLYSDYIMRTDDYLQKTLRSSFGLKPNFSNYLTDEQKTLIDKKQLLEITFHVDRLDAGVIKTHLKELGLTGITYSIASVENIRVFNKDHSDYTDKVRLKMLIDTRQENFEKNIENLKERAKAAKELNPKRGRHLRTSSIKPDDIRKDDIYIS